MPRKKKTVKKRYTREELEEMLGTSEPKKKYDNPRKCIECGSLDIDHDGEEFFCRKCGYVLENI